MAAARCATVLDDVPVALRLAVLGSASGDPAEN
jgi:hypothetical protein